MLASDSGHGEGHVLNALFTALRRDGDRRQAAVIFLRGRFSGFRLCGGGGFLRPGAFKRCTPDKGRAGQKPNVTFE